MKELNSAFLQIKRNTKYAQASGEIKGVRGKREEGAGRGREDIGSVKSVTGAREGGWEMNEDGWGTAQSLKCTYGENKPPPPEYCSAEYK